MSLPASKPAGSGHSRLVWVLLGIAVVIVVGMGVFGMIVYHRRSKELKAKKLEQRLRVWRMRRELKRKATRLPAGQCAEGMIWISTSSSNGKGGDEPGFCIDKYEYPNKKSVHPESIADVSEAKKACAKLGKRLCTKAEWQRACVGPKNLRFPYGPKYDPSKCATKPAGGESPPVQASGSWPDCRSAEGVLDMSGNVAEWVSGGALMGGSGALTGRDTSCTAEGGGGGPAYYGARCCTSPATGE
jgi:formylglycine-generating enzyme required for sulfatase activity